MQVYHCQIYQRFDYHDSFSHASYVPVFINFYKEYLHFFPLFVVSRVYNLNNIEAKSRGTAESWKKQ